MKKILIAVLALLAAGVMMIAIPLSGRFAVIQYKRRVEMDALAAEGEDGWLRAERGGVVTLLEGDNIRRVTRLITPIELTRAYSQRQAQEEIRLTYSSGDTLRLLSDAAREDRVLIEFTSGGQDALFALEGRHVLEALEEAVSPEGFSGANTVVEGE